MRGTEMENKYTELNYDRDTKMYSGEPEIKKLGACSPGHEMTPFVWNGKLMRLELAEPDVSFEVGVANSHFVIRDIAEGKIISSFGEGGYYCSGYLEGDTFYVFADITTPGYNGNLVTRSGDKIKLYSSKDLVNWDEKIVIDRPGWRMYNTACTKGPDGYILVTEISHPNDLAGDKPFTCVFNRSDTVDGEYTLMDAKPPYPMDRYCGGPWIKYVDGYYYLICVTELPCERYTNYLTRSKDLVNWEVGKYNPLFMPSAEDRMLSPNASGFTPEQIESLKTFFNCNNSDVDLVDYNGQVYFNYIAGNQHGYGHECEAVCDGTVADFLKNFFI